MKRFRLILPLLLFTLLMFFAGCSNETYGPSKQVEFLWQQHPAPWSEQAARAAAEDAKGLMASHPNDLQLEMYYQNRMSQVDQEAIIEEYKERLEKDSTDARNILLEARAVGGRNRKADRLKVAIGYAPKDPYVLSMAAMAVLRSRPAEPELAMTYAREAVEIAPDLSLAHEALAKAFLEQEMFEDALREAETASQQDPHTFDPVAVAMQALEEVGSDDEALQRLETFEEQQPLNPTALYYLEHYYRDRGELEKIIGRKRLAAIANPEQGYAWLDLASNCLELGQMDSVMSALNAAIENDFFDLDYTMTLFDEDQLRDIASNSQWKAVQARMKKMRVDTREERRAEALKEKLDDPAPAFTATTLDGREVSLEDLRGEVVILDFWATWCGPCRMTIPRLQDFYKTGAKGAEMISMNVWERVPAEERVTLVSQFAEDEGMDWNVWLAKNETAGDYGVLGIPTFVVIDKQGTIRYKLIGYQPFLDEVLGWMVEDAGTM